jgi:hypothetical protein
MKLDAQVDMLEFKTYSEIDLDESPVVALTCGQFFTAETLDGMYDFRGSSITSAVVPMIRVSSVLLVLINSRLRATSEKTWLTRPISM